MNIATPSTCVKIRGIYATALTRVMLDDGFTIASPSPEIQQRFDLSESDADHDIFIRDRKDRQGIEVFGEVEALWGVVRVLRERLLDMALLVCKPLESDEGTWRACIELPGASKEHLDAARSEVLPTLTRHHRLRAAQTKGLERMESDLLNHPERKAPLEQRAFRNLILAPLARRERVHIEHVKPCGKSIPPRIGRLVKTENNHFIMKRIFLSEGRYDGLDLPMERGDYGITEAREGQWCIKHSYYSAQGRLKGEYYNINTPVELYPFGGRYLDLEIDVVRRAGEKPFLVDRDKFAVLAREGAISQALYRKAVETAESLMRELTQ